MWWCGSITFGVCTCILCEDVCQCVKFSELKFTVKQWNLTKLYVTGNPSLPGTVVCGVCGAVRFYRFVKQARKFGIFSCESCRKFVSKMMKRQGSSKGGKLPVLECHKGQGEEKLFAYPVLLCLGFGIVSTKKSQNRHKIVQPNILKYVLQTGKYALNTHTHRSLSIHLFCLQFYSSYSIQCIYHWPY